jgi:hypothetical protein
MADNAHPPPRHSLPVGHAEEQDYFQSIAPKPNEPTKIIVTSSRFERWPNGIRYLITYTKTRRIIPESTQAKDVNKAVKGTPTPMFPVSDEGMLVLA